MASILLIAQTVAAAAVVLSLYNYFSSPLGSVPGPLLAKFSNIWRLLDVWSGSADVTQRDLHRTHGDFVRIGPNTVSIADPDLINTIYGGREPFPKGQFYLAGATFSNGKRLEGIFNTNNEDLHSYMIRPVKGAFSQTNILKLEPLVDKTLDHLVQKLRREYVSVGEGPCDLGRQLHYFAWDVIGDATFSERLGVLDGNPQMLGLIEAGGRASDYLGLIGQMPILEQVLNNPHYPLSTGGFGPAAGFAAQRLGERKRGTDGHDPKQPDMLDLFIDAETDGEDAGTLSRRQMGWVMMNMVAGSDTTATALRSAIYFVARDPTVKGRVLAELRGTKAGLRPDWKTVHSLPYFDAVIKETLRLEPAVGLMLERVVPAEGLRLPNGTVLPQGTTVGVNPRVVNHDERAFGRDADEFVPDRWLRGEMESEPGYEDRLSRMRRADFTFSAGKRGCIGRNLALLEVYKCVSRLLLEFDISLAHPDRPWTSKTGFFMKQYGVDVLLKEHAK